MAGKRLMRDEEGSVVIEFALLVPIFFLVIFVIIDFSRAYYQLNTINSALREGAREASVIRWNSTAVADCPSTAACITRVRATVHRFSTSFGKTIDTSAVSVVGNPNLAFPLQVTVSVTNYPFNFITPLPNRVGVSSVLNMTRSATFRWEFAP